MTDKSRTSTNDSSLFLRVARQIVIRQQRSHSNCIDAVTKYVYHPYDHYPRVPWEYLGRDFAGIIVKRPAVTKKKRKLTHPRLSIELCRHILHFLTFEDTMRVSQTTQTTRRIVFECCESISLRCFARRIDDSVVKWLTLRFCNVRQVDFTECRAITDVACRQIARSWPDLHTISLGNCLKVSDRGIRDLVSLLRLQNLDVSGCHLLTDACSQAIREMKELRTLKFMYCRRLTDATLAQVACLSNLRALSCIYCPQITSSGVAHLVKLADQLEYLSFWFCHQLDSDCGDSLGKMHRLRSLDVANCEQLDDLFLKKIATKSSRLTNLNLWGCREISDHGIQSIARLRHLTVLNLANCVQLTNQSIELLSQLEHLTCVNLLNCHRISPDVLSNAKVHWIY